MTDDVEVWAKRLRLVGNPIRLMVMLSLYSSNVIRKSEHSLRYTEIIDLIGTPDDSSLNYHLRELEQAKVITKDPVKDENGEVYPIYHITEEGKKILEDLGLLKLLDEQLKKMAR
jgi:DNA-binding HxlR family transcriptional regulator